jgi:1-acyl-sn-glycerol-3-phosphate acyltransferase
MQAKKISLTNSTPAPKETEAARFGDCTRKYYLPARPLGFALFRLYFRLQVTGLEHLPTDSGGIIVPNHTSFLDPPLMSAVVPRVVYYLMLSHHYYHPRWHWLFSRLPCIPMARGSLSNAEAMKLCLHVLEHGQLLCMFPEGGISHHHKANGVRPGAALLASRSQTPIIPAGIVGAAVALPLHAKFPRAKPITIRFGAPIFAPVLDTRDKDELHALMHTTMARIHALTTGE